MLLTEELHRWAGYSNGLDKQKTIIAKIIRFITPNPLITALSYSVYPNSLLQGDDILKNVLIVFPSLIFLFQVGLK